jgi:hypothetical protein
MSWNRSCCASAAGCASRHRDSDGDEHFALTATVHGRKRKLLHEMNDERNVMRLGRFLATHAGWTLRT